MRKNRSFFVRQSLLLAAVTLLSAVPLAQAAEVEGSHEIPLPPVGRFRVNVRVDNEQATLYTPRLRNAVLTLEFRVTASDVQPNVAVAPIDCESGVGVGAELTVGMASIETSGTVAATISGTTSGASGEAIPFETSTGELEIEPTSTGDHDLPQIAAEVCFED